MRLLLALPLMLSLAVSTGAQVEPLKPPGQATDVAAADSFIPDSPPSSIPPAQQKLAYCVVIENRTGGMVRIVDPPAQFLLARPGKDLGLVTRPASSVDTEGFHASLWGQAQTVVASAVNAIHIKAFDEPAGGRAAVITILPQELLRQDLNGLPAAPSDKAIYTDIPGGRGIFGGAYPVLTGNPASIYRGRQHIYFDASNTALEVGDVIIIEVRTPEQWPKGLTIENREAGSVTLSGADGARTVCATVSKPVSGTGRFEGGIFSLPGGIRATHSGVLDIDLSPEGEMGGLQFIPYAHSLSAELTYSQASPPYGILIGVDGSDLRGQAPVFAGYIYPQSGLEAPAVLPRLGVSVQLGLSTMWLPVPSMAGREVLTDLAMLRIEWLNAPAPPVVPATETSSQPAPAAPAPPKLRVSPW